MSTEGLDEFLKELGFEILPNTSESNPMISEESKASEEGLSQLENLARKLNLPLDEDKRNAEIYKHLTLKLQDRNVHSELQEKIQKLLTDFDDLSDPPTLGLQFCLLSALVKMHEKAMKLENAVIEKLRERLQAVDAEAKEEMEKEEKEDPWRRIPASVFVITSQPGLEKEEEISSGSEPSGSENQQKIKIRHLDSIDD